MLHEISPKEYKVEYNNIRPKPEDTVFIFDGNGIYYRKAGGELSFPAVSELNGIDADKLVYLFSIDGARFFMPDIHGGDTVKAPDGYEMADNWIFREAAPKYMSFAAVTAQSLYLWYRQNKYCGTCGAENGHSEKERACVCPVCGNVVYPKISPVVIVGVINGDALLVTRYKDRPYRRYALVAGFAEIGESLEDTVRREVFEETGVRVKNIRYYKSQPWGFTSTLLSGYYCELDGSPDITVDETELSEALWCGRGELPPADSDIALTSEMMEMFRLGREQYSIDS